MWDLFSGIGRVVPLWISGPVTLLLAIAAIGADFMMPGRFEYEGFPISYLGYGLGIAGVMQIVAAVGVARTKREAEEETRRIEEEMRQSAVEDDDDDWDDEDGDDWDGAEDGSDEDLSGWGQYDS